VCSSDLDGYITGRNLGIALSITDINHLLKFLKDIEADFLPKSYISKGYSEVEYCRVLFKSTFIVNDLNLSYGGRLKVIDALSYFYKDSNTYLDRKKEKYEKLMNM